MNHGATAVSIKINCKHKLFGNYNLLKYRIYWPTGLEHHHSCLVPISDNDFVGLDVLQELSQT